MLYKQTQELWQLPFSLSLVYSELHSVFVCEMHCNAFLAIFIAFKFAARKSIKGSKDLDSSLVSKENFSETLWPSG